MALGSTTITGRGYTKVYTVPAGKRAVVNAIAHANSSSEVVLAAEPSADLSYSTLDLGSVPFLSQTSASGSERNLTSQITHTFTGNANNRYFGGAVAISGNYAVVGGAGGWTNNESGNSPTGGGQIYIYFFDGTNWTLQQTITDPSGNNGANFGFAVDIDGTNIVVGDPFNDQTSGNSGRAYRYTRSGSTWSLSSTYINPNSNSDDRFGYSVAIAGDYIVIGSTGFSGSASIGRAYGYRPSTGSTLQVTYTNPSGNNNEFFGNSVACWSDGRALIGARGYPNSGAGRAYYYGAFSSTLSSTITNPDGSTQDNFGRFVTCDKTGTYFAIAATFWSNSGGTGRVYTYSSSSPATLLQTISSPVSLNNSFFGWSTAMDSQGRLLVGSRGLNGSSGGAYFYSRSGSVWTLARTLGNPSDAASDAFGGAVALGLRSPISTAAYIYRNVSVTISFTGSAGQPIALIGAPLDNNNTFTINGAAYFYIGEIPLVTNTITTINTAIDQFLAIPDVTLDRLTMSLKQTFERTGLVLDAGESLVISLPEAAGNVAIQVRGYEETV
jgi:hypothetical protein